MGGAVQPGGSAASAECDVLCFYSQAEQRVGSEIAARLGAIGPDRATWPAAARQEVGITHLLNPDQQLSDVLKTRTPQANTYSRSQSCLWIRVEAAEESAVASLADCAISRHLSP